MATVRAVAAVVPAPPAPAKQAATTPSFKLAGADGRCLPVSQTMARIKAQGKVCTYSCLIPLY
jgi:indole-3-glycerol-phosphate lyase